VNKIIIDCDVGVDDALALILAFHSPELEVMAVTGVNGNVPLDRVFVNIQKVLSLIQPAAKPFIAKGADRPLRGESPYAHSVHGQDGLGGAYIDQKEKEEWWKAYEGHAANLIPEMARRYPDEITLVAVGPLTNLALALHKDPTGMKNIKEIISMGGAVRSQGNITPYAEFNIFSDPLAARLVFESGLPVTLVPLDVTHQVFLTPLIMKERISLLENPFYRFLMEATGYDRNHQQFHRKDLIYLHDPLAVGAVIDPNLLRKEKLALQVETQEGEQYGRTREVERGPEIKVCLEVDAKRFVGLFLSRLG